MNNQKDYFNKYLKYKLKYLDLKNQDQNGGAAAITSSRIPSVSIIRGKSQDIANRPEFRNKKIGLLVASNPGRPGGSLGKMDGTGLASSYKKNFSTQEESVIASWFQAEEHIFNLNKKSNDKNKFDCCEKFKDTLGVNATSRGRPWGMLNPESTSVKTIQGKDFTLPFFEKGISQPQRATYYSFAYHLPNKPIFNSNKDSIKTVDLFFVYGPNVAASNTPTGSMSRTKIKEYRFPRDYPIFRDGVKNAIRAGLISMANADIKVAILARISGGIYSGNGNTNRQINNDYINIINELLLELYPNTNRQLGSYFTNVILT